MFRNIFILILVTICSVQVLNAGTISQISSVETFPNSLKRTLNFEYVHSEVEQQLETIANETGANLVNSIRCLERVQPALRKLEHLITQELEHCQGKHECEYKLLEEVSKLEKRIVNDFQKCLILRTSYSSSKILDLEHVLKEVEQQLETVAEDAGASLIISVLCLESIQGALKELENLTMQGPGYCKGQEECENKILEDVSKLQEKIVNDFKKCLISHTSSKLIDLDHALAEVIQQLETLAEEGGASLVISILCLETVQPALRALEYLANHIPENCLEQQECENKILEVVSNLENKITTDYHKCLVSRKSSEVPTKSTFSRSSNQMIDLENVLTDVEQRLETVADEAGANLVNSLLCLKSEQPDLRKLENLINEGPRQCNEQQECGGKLLEEVFILQEKIVTDFKECITK